MKRKKSSATETARDAFLFRRMNKWLRCEQRQKQREREKKVILRRKIHGARSLDATLRQQQMLYAENMCVTYLKAITVCWRSSLSAAELQSRPCVSVNGEWLSNI